MTARDAATEADPTDEVGPGTSDPAAGADDAPGAETDTTADTTKTDVTSDGAPDGATARSRRRRGRRRGEGDDAEDTAGPRAADDGTGTAAAGPRRRTGRLVAAALVVAALFAGAMAVLYVASKPDPVAGITARQQAAITAATQAAINLQTFRRASFDQDFANALASLTPEFGQQQLLPRKDALKQQLTSGGRDASATALSAGLVSSTPTQAVVLVVTNTTQTADNGTSTPFVFSRLQLTLQYTGGKWLVSDLRSVGLS